MALIEQFPLWWTQATETTERNVRHVTLGVIVFISFLDRGPPVPLCVVALG